MALSKVIAFLVYVFVSGCAFSSKVIPSSNVFLEDYPGVSERDVWQATLRTLGDFGIEKQNARKGEIQTSWVTGWSDRPFGAVGGGVMGATWKRRFRLKAEVTGGAGISRIKLISFVEEKPPGGREAYRWERVASNGQLEREIFSLVRERVERRGQETPASTTSESF